MSAMLAAGLAASAQTQEALRVKEGCFDFLPKHLTTTGQVTPYSVIGGSDSQVGVGRIYNLQRVFQQGQEFYLSSSHI